MRAGVRRVSLIHLFALLLVTGAPVLAEPDPASEPVKPARRIFDTWLEVYNSGAEDRVADFIGERFAPSFLAQIPADALVAFHKNLMRDQGELTLDRIEEDGESLLVALLRDETGGLLSVTMGIEPAAPHRITGMRIVPPEKTSSEAGGEAAGGEAAGDAAAGDEADGDEADEAAAAEPPMPWPSTQAGRLGRGWVGAFNADGDAAMRRFEAANRTQAALGAVPIEERIERFLELRRQLGEITPSRVLSAAEGKITILARSAVGPPWIELDFELGGEGNAKLSAVSLSSTSSETASLDLADADGK